MEAFKQFEDRTCFRFHVRTQADTYGLKFFKGNGCYSYRGYVKGRTSDSDTNQRQKVSIGDGCEYTGTVCHEVMHALGFYHEQSRPDREKYVRINWENIEAGKESNFKMAKEEEIDTQGLGYDYDGIMHYGAHAFSKNGLKTIEVIGGENKEIESKSSNQMSQDDVNEINLAYDCPNNMGKDYSDWTPWSPCNGVCESVRDRVCYKQNNADCAAGTVDKVQIEKKKCENCGVDGGYGHWGQWSSGNLELKPITRSRQCDNPKPYGTGKGCQGIAEESIVCYNSVGDYQCNIWIPVYKCSHSYVADRCKASCGGCDKSKNIILTCDTYKPDEFEECSTSFIQKSPECTMTITVTDSDGNATKQDQKHVCQTSCKSCS